jgi:hypothetical protein
MFTNKQVGKYRSDMNKCIGRSGFAFMWEKIIPKKTDVNIRRPTPKS